MKVNAEIRKKKRKKGNKNRNNQKHNEMKWNNSGQLNENKIINGKNV